MNTELDFSNTSLLALLNLYYGIEGGEPERDEHALSNLFETLRISFELLGRRVLM
jgi:hypothetical protein